MKTTPKTAKVLAEAIKTHGWQQADLATRAKIAAQTVSLHLNGSRVIRDDHLALYMTALDKAERILLVSAWLQDTLPPDAVQDVLDGATSSVREEVRAWRPGLTPEQADMIDFWVAQLVDDDELARIFVTITRRSGWQPKPITHGTTLDHAAKTTPHPATDQPRSM